MLIELNYRFFQWLLDYRSKFIQSTSADGSEPTTLYSSTLIPNITMIATYATYTVVMKQSLTRKHVITSSQHWLMQPATISFNCFLECDRILYAQNTTSENTVADGWEHTRYSSFFSLTRTRLNDTGTQARCRWIGSPISCRTQSFWTRLNQAHPESCHLPWMQTMTMRALASETRVSPGSLNLTTLSKRRLVVHIDLKLTGNSFSSLIASTLLLAPRRYMRLWMVTFHSLSSRGSGKTSILMALLGRCLTFRL